MYPVFPELSAKWKIFSGRVILARFFQISGVVSVKSFSGTWSDGAPSFARPTYANKIMTHLRFLMNFSNKIVEKWSVENFFGFNFSENRLKINQGWFSGPDRTNFFSLEWFLTNSRISLAVALTPPTLFTTDQSQRRDPEF